MRRILLIIILAVSITACQRDTSGQDSESGKSNPAGSYTLKLDASPANLGQLKMNLNQLGAFHGRFVLDFEGQSAWRYQVDTRSDGTNVEYQLALQGLESSQNLGDVRLVNSYGNNFMSGPGTGDVCVQFPDAFETEPLFLGPTEFIHLKEFSSVPEETGNETILGMDVVHYTTSAPNHLGWQDVTVSFWVEPQSQAVLKYEFTAQGRDPLYGKGEGRFHGLFEVLEIGQQDINAVPDCVIEFPLPEDAENIIRFPGLLSFTTSLGPNRLNKFYLQALEPRGWVSESPQINPETRDGVMEFNQQDRSVVIKISAINPQNFSLGYVVEILMDE